MADLQKSRSQWHHRWCHQPLHFWTNKPWSMGAMGDWLDKNASERALLRRPFNGESGDEHYLCLSKQIRKRMSDSIGLWFLVIPMPIQEANEIKASHEKATRIESERLPCWWGRHSDWPAQCRFLWSQADPLLRISPPWLLQNTILSVFVQVGDSYSLAHERR